jgi:hypothetical protein
MPEEHAEEYETILNEWSNRKPFDYDLNLLTFILNYYSREEIDRIFCQIRDKMNSSPCCMCHSGVLPISVNSINNTPYVGGGKCDKPHRSMMRTLRRAYITLSTGQDPVELHNVP